MRTIIFAFILLAAFSRDAAATCSCTSCLAETGTAVFSCNPAAGCDCTSTPCPAGTGNCDGLQGNGCEVGILSNDFNCGGCGTTCVDARFCSNGACTNCTGTMRNCTPSATSADCETNIASDANNCNGCGIVCSNNHVTSSCVSSVCAGGCALGWADCNGNKRTDGCETPLALSATDCGGCGQACGGQNQFCNSSGGCVSCSPNTGNCDGDMTNQCETNLLTDINNCGACNHACGAGQACCSGGCVDLGTDANCKSCAQTCSNTEYCGPTGCTNCTGTLRNCDLNTLGCETDTATSIAHCGGCGNNCASTVQNATGLGCAASKCTFTCNAGFGDCDVDPVNGCEINLGTDANNCGACGVKCVAAGGANSCVNGACVPACDAQHQDCDGNPANGCESLKASDTGNCGGCGVVCPSPAYGTAVCSGGSCGAVCIMDAGVTLKQCTVDGGAVECGQCCADADCAAPPDKCHETAGQCVGGFCAYTQKSCAALDCHSDPVCNLSTGDCDSTPLTGGTCGQSGCYVGGAVGTCSSGQCVDGNGQPLQQVDCTQNVPACKVGVCNRAGVCDTVDATNGITCNGNACALAASCQGGACVATSTKSCTPSGTCQAASCDPITGDCVQTPAPAGTACSSGDECRTNELCDSAGNCVGTPKSDGNPCTLADCPSGGACASGTCTCGGGSDFGAGGGGYDAFLGRDDLGAPNGAGHGKSGCSYGGGGAGSSTGVMLWLLIAIAISRRFRRRLY